MEFKFRAVDDRSPPFPSPPPVFNSFTELALSGQPFPPMSNFASWPISNVPSGFPTRDLWSNLDPIRNLNGFRDLIMQEIEKERFRDEVILAEIARRRELEAEVRREIMFLEREITMRRAATEAFSFEDRWAVAPAAAMPYGPRPPLPPVHSFGDELSAFSSRSTAFDTFSLARPLDDIVREFKNPSEPNKDKLIVLAKPSPNLSGAKRKAEAPPSSNANELHPFGLKKKPKEEWSCALCQVGATSEKGLNEHLQGKKHKAREARLITERMGKTLGDTPFTKKAGNLSKPTNGKKELLKQKKKSTRDLEKTSKGTDHKADRTEENKKRFKFWCEICEVGSKSFKVMEDHKRGKKHMARVLASEPNKSDSANLITTTTTEILLETIVQKPKDPNAGDQADDTTMDGMANKVKSEDLNVADQATKEITVQKPEDPNCENQAGDETTDSLTNKVKSEDANVADQTTKKITVQKPEDPNCENQADIKTTDKLANKV